MMTDHSAIFEAAAKAQKALAMLIAPDAIKATTPMTAFAAATEAEVSLRAALAQRPEPFQARVRPWMLACFGPEISADRVERGDRFIEEALELVQAIGYSPARAHALVDYVFGRPVGEPHQEVGGVMITLAALCLTCGLNIDRAAEDELARVWEKVDAIRTKQAAKPTGSALPIAQPEPHPDDIAVDNFTYLLATAMKAKLAAKRAQGFGGWDDPSQCSVQTLSGLLRRHVEKGDPVDVANLAMMIHHHGAEILPIDDATEFDAADHYWRDIDPEDCGNHPQEALSKGYVGHYTVCAVSCSFTGPTRFGFSAPVLDPESDDEEFLHFGTEDEALAAAQERCAIIEARDNKCPVCNEAMNPDDLCATDVSLGICHAECLEGAPVVDLNTGEPMDGPMNTYRYSDLP